MSTNLIDSAKVMRMLGNCSPMSLRRWMALPRDPVPAPIAVLGRRRFWEESEVRAWVARQAPPEREEYISQLEAESIEQDPLRQYALTPEESKETNESEF